MTKVRVFITLQTLAGIHCYCLGPSDELITMIKSHNNQDNILTFIAQHPETLNQYVSGYTPLMHAIFEDLSDVAERIIQQGADVHQKDHTELATALMYAVAYDLPGTVSALLARGAQLTDKDKHGKTVWDYSHKAERMGRPQARIIRNLLEQHAASKGLTVQ